MRRLGHIEGTFYPDKETNQYRPECGGVLLKCSKYRRWWDCQGGIVLLQRASAYRDMVIIL